MADTCVLKSVPQPEGSKLGQIDKKKNCKRSVLSPRCVICKSSLTAGIEFSRGHSKLPLLLHHIFFNCNGMTEALSYREMGWKEIACLAAIEKVN